MKTPLGFRFAATYAGIRKNGPVNYFANWAPASAPPVLKQLIWVIHAVSEIFRLVSLAHVSRFLRDYLRRHWAILRHAQFKDPVLSLLMTLEKAAGGRDDSEEARNAD